MISLRLMIHLWVLSPFPCHSHRRQRNPWQEKETTEQYHHCQAISPGSFRVQHTLKHSLLAETHRHSFSFFQSRHLFSRLECRSLPRFLGAPTKRRWRERERESEKKWIRTLSKKDGGTKGADGLNSRRLVDSDKGLSPACAHGSILSAVAGKL